MDAAFDWLPLTDGDMDGVCAVAARLHPGLPERAEVLAEKLRLFPAGCRKLAAGGRLAGYGLAHPWTLGSAPKLDAFLGALPAAPDCLYLHDVAILPEARGRGAAGAYVEYLGRVAGELGLRRLALVSVYGTAPLWTRFGFAPVSAGVPPLASYGPSAVYMVKTLNS